MEEVLREFKKLYSEYKKFCIAVRLPTEELGTRIKGRSFSGRNFDKWVKEEGFSIYVKIGLKNGYFYFEADKFKMSSYSITFDINLTSEQINNIYVEAKEYLDYLNAEVLPHYKYGELPVPKLNPLIKPVI